jgi:hypothetical protein
MLDGSCGMHCVACRVMKVACECHFFTIGTNTAVSVLYEIREAVVVNWELALIVI